MATGAAFTAAGAVGSAAADMVGSAGADTVGSAAADVVGSAARATGPSPSREAAQQATRGTWYGTTGSASGSNAFNRPSWSSRGKAALPRDDLVGQVGC